MTFAFSAHANPQLPNGKIVLMVSKTDRIHTQFSNDLQRLGRLHGFDIVTRTSQGSLENLMSIVSDDQVNMAFIQADIPPWIAGRLRDSDRPGSAIRKFLVRVKTLHPLDNEVVQIVTRLDINTLADLKERKIAIGSVRSGSFLTIGHIFQDEGIEFEAIHLSGQNALAKLKTGEVDAVAMVSGYPEAELQSFEGAGYHLLPVVLPHGDKVYVPTKIPAKTYAWQKEAIQTVAIKIFLATYDYPKSMPVCKRLRKFSDIVEKNIDWLKTNGHAHWQQVNFNYFNSSTRGFLRSRCIREY